MNLRLLHVIFPDAYAGLLRKLNSFLILQRGMVNPPPRPTESESLISQISQIILALFTVEGWGCSGYRRQAFLVQAVSVIALTAVLVCLPAVSVANVVCQNRLLSSLLSQNSMYFLDADRNCYATTTMDSQRGGIVTQSLHSAITLSQSVLTALTLGLFFRDHPFVIDNRALPLKPHDINVQKIAIKSYLTHNSIDSSKRCKLEQQFDRIITRQRQLELQSESSGTVLIYLSLTDEQVRGAIHSESVEGVRLDIIREELSLALLMAMIQALPLNDLLDLLSENQEVLTYAGGLGGAGGGGDDDPDPLNSGPKDKADDDVNPVDLWQIPLMGLPFSDIEIDEYLLSENEQQKRRLLRIVWAKLQQARRTGNRNLIKILKNRIMLIKAERADLRALGQQKGETARSNLRTLLLAGLLENESEVAAFDGLGLLEQLRQKADVDERLYTEAIILPGQEFRAYTSWLGTVQGQFYQVLKKHLERLLKDSMSAQYELNRTLSVMELLALGFWQNINSGSHTGRQVPDHKPAIADSPRQAGTIEPVTGQYQSATGHLLQKAVYQNNQPDDPQGQSDKHTFSEACCYGADCNGQPCKKRPQNSGDSEGMSDAFKANSKAVSLGKRSCDSRSDGGQCPTTAPKKTKSAEWGTEGSALMDSLSMRGSTSLFDCLFLTSDDDLNKLLAEKSANGGAEVILVKNADSLARDGLQQRLEILDDGSRRLSPGKLFENDAPLTLVLDVRTMSSRDIASFNDLLDPDTPSHYSPKDRKKRKLGSHVSVIVITAPEQLSKDGPAADFWRRVKRHDNSWELSQDSMENEPVECILSEPALSPGADPNTLTLNLHLSSDWRWLLYGGPGTDMKGHIRHIPGKLEHLKTGQSVIFKGANWADLEFQQAVRQLMAKQTFESNGTTRQLAGDVRFFQSPVQEGELRDLYQSFENITGPITHPVIINQANLEQWLAPIRINSEGYAVPNTTLQEQLKAGGTVTITSPLSEAAWFTLLGRLQELRHLNPRLFLAHPEGQPDSLELTEAEAKQKSPIATSERIAVRTVKETVAQGTVLNETPDALDVMVNELTLPGQLFDNLHIASEEKPLFSRHFTELQVALHLGRPVVIRGLNSNPQLQQFLEPLCCPVPSVIINGVVQQYPNARITILWAEGEKSPSPVWQALIQQSDEAMDIDLWGEAETRNGLLPATIPVGEIKALYEAFTTIPITISKKIGQLPSLSAGLLDQLVSTALQAQRQDGAVSLMPRHWRRAINRVIIDKTRQDQRVWDFMTVACHWLLPDSQEGKDLWVDTEELAEIIPADSPVTWTFVRDHFWQLARCFGRDTFKYLQLNFNQPSSESYGPVATMAKLLAVYSPRAVRDSIRLTLNPERLDESLCRLPAKSLRRIKRLEDAMAGGMSIRPAPDKTSTVEYLARAGVKEAQNTGTNNVNKVSRLVKLLQIHLQTPSNMDSLKILATELLAGSTNQAERERHRLQNLRARLTETPVVFIVGETGTGKSYFARKVASEAGRYFTISVGPSTGETDLVQKWVWKENTPLDDRYMERQEEVLLQWAVARPEKEGDLVTVVIDEASLGRPGLLTALSGLWKESPCIYVNGQPVPVTKSHRVILTGNPESYAGRHMDSRILSQAEQIFYPPMDQAFLHDLVVLPALVSQLSSHYPNLTREWIIQLADNAAKAVMTLWQHYQHLLSNRTFTPRDLTDICAWVGWYMNLAAAGGALPDGGVSSGQLNTLVWQSFSNVLGFEARMLPENALVALESWFNAHFPTNRNMLDTIQAGELDRTRGAFLLNTANTMPWFDTSASAVTELAEALAQDLSRCQQAWSSNRKHGGRQATLIEGPTGRGKDVTLKLAIDSFRSQLVLQNKTLPEVHYLNAGDCSWQTLLEHIKRAISAGEILVISEMNLINSQHLEGSLNSALAGEAHPGFHLFATVNPSSYSGRNPLSPALEARFRRLPVQQYRQDELTGIAQKLLPDTKEGKACGDQLTNWHCRLRQSLLRGDIALLPTSGDLQKLAEAVDSTTGGAGAEEALFSQHYWLYLKAAGISLEQLKEKPFRSQGQPFDHALSQWLNYAITRLEAPWQVSRGSSDSLNGDQHQITIKQDLDDEKARLKIIRLMAENEWRQSGMPLSPPESGDTLTQAMYIYWQWYWFIKRFGLVNPDAIFPATPVQRATMGMDTNQPYFRQADDLLNTMNHDRLVNWPGYWHQLQALLQFPVATDQRNAEMRLPWIPVDRQATVTEVTREVDARTDYEPPERVPQTIQRIFNHDTSPKMYRIGVYDIAVTNEGDVEATSAGKGEYGYEAVEPSQLAKSETLVLGQNQTYGIYKFQLGDVIRLLFSIWIELPGLNCHERITSMRIEPEAPFIMLRDRYTGTYKLFIPQSRYTDMAKTLMQQPSDMNYTVYYIVEKVASSDMPILQNRPDRTCSAIIQKTVKQLFNDRNLPIERQQELQAILQEVNPSKRIDRIAEYCRQFKTEKTRESGENLLLFLLREQQGGYRHRGYAFLALCRYFEIPTRMITNQHSSYEEYSLDQGQTWQVVDLGGKPDRDDYESPDFPKTTTGVVPFSTNSQLPGILKSLSTEQAEALAKVYGITGEELQQAMDSGTALPVKEVPRNHKVVEALWSQEKLADFSVGNQLLASKEKLDIYERGVLDCYWGSKEGREGFISTVSKLIMSDETVDKTLDELESFYSQAVKKNTRDKINFSQWQYSVIDVLLKATKKGITSPVIQAAKRILENHWLDENELVWWGSRDIKIFQLFNALATVDELRPLVRQKQLQWYGAAFSNQISPPKSNRELTLPLSQGAETLNGASSLLESKLKRYSLSDAWTEQPEGIPDMQRLLSGLPAFKTSGQGSIHHRPVMMLVTHNPFLSILRDKKSKLFQLYLQNNPEDYQLMEKSKKLEKLSIQEQQEIFDMRNRLSTYMRDENRRRWKYIKAGSSGMLEDRERLAHFREYKWYEDYNYKEYEKQRNLEKQRISEQYSIEAQRQNCNLSEKEETRLQDIESSIEKIIYTALIHYIYHTSNSRGGQLTFYFGDSFGTGTYCSFGSCIPQSPEELATLVENRASSDSFIEVLDNGLLQEALQSHNPLVLYGSTLETIATEFMDSLELELFWQELARFIK